MEAKHEAPPPVSPFVKKCVLVLNCSLLALGNCGGPLVSRLYFLHGGNRVWLSSWLQTVGWPIILIPLAIIYMYDRSKNANAQLVKIQFPVFLAAAGIGVLTGFDDYFYAYGLSRLPVSTSSLIIATQLIFTAGFAFLLVKQRFTPYSINSIVLLTVASSMLALNTDSDRPEGESTKQYVIGFLMTLAAAALYGLILPLVELMYTRAKQNITYTLVLEIQTVICFTATAVCTIGMLINNDFKVITREAREYGLGETKYYVVLVFSAILWQFFFLGAIGVVFCASSLLSGVLISVLLPVTEVLAVIFFHESFKAEKGVSLGLSLWGFISYFYGEATQSKKNKLTPETRKGTDTTNGTECKNGTEMSTRSSPLLSEV